jgi:hypothetical protein
VCPAVYTNAKFSFQFQLEEHQINHWSIISICYPILVRLNSRLDAASSRMDINPITSTGQIVKNIEHTTPTTASQNIPRCSAQIPPTMAIRPVAKSAPFRFAEDSTNGISANMPRSPDA